MLFSDILFSGICISVSGANKVSVSRLFYFYSSEELCVHTSVAGIKRSE